MPATSMAFPACKCICLGLVLCAECIIFHTRMILRSHICGLTYTTLCLKEHRRVPHGHTFVSLEASVESRIALWQFISWLHSCCDFQRVVCVIFTIVEWLQSMFTLWIWIQAVCCWPRGSYFIIITVYKIYIAHKFEQAQVRGTGIARSGSWQVERE